MIQLLTNSFHLVELVNSWKDLFIRSKKLRHFFCYPELIHTDLQQKLRKIFIEVREYNDSPLSELTVEVVACHSAFCEICRQPAICNFTLAEPRFTNFLITQAAKTKAREASTPEKIALNLTLPASINFLREIFAVAIF